MANDEKTDAKPDREAALEARKRMVRRALGLPENPAPEETHTDGAAEARRKMILRDLAANLANQQTKKGHK